MSNINVQQYKKLLKANNIKDDKRISIEDTECEHFFSTLQFQLFQKEIPDVFQIMHIPNQRYQGTDKRFFGQLVKLKKMGMINGCPDYIIVFNDSKGVLYLEFKAHSGKYKGKLSVAQKLFQKDCIKRKNPYHVVYSKEEAINILKLHIKQLYMNE